MEPLPKEVTIGDKYRPAMEIRDQGEADAYFERLVAHTQGFGESRERAEEVERINLGYFAGYYDSLTRERVERLFRCAHPVFGKVAENGSPTMEESLKAGRELTT